MAKDISTREDDHLPITRGEARKMIVEIGQEIMAPFAEGMLSLIKGQQDTSAKLGRIAGSLEEMAQRNQSQSSSYLGNSHIGTDWDEHERNAQEAYRRRGS